MMSKEKQAVKNLNVENAQQENEREEQAIPNRHIDHNEVGDDVEKFIGQMMGIRRKTKEQQMRHHKCF
ncbi:unnamed protein product [Nyctereutes procyonoides]|uniref:(raccoon dog) hypothetical protein n=1 Tax=Nyctereutes procyonoides TaxID=34880 RepID=A0A811Z508_NYCPR|nr:unnamed protein product [Nyctereutes procyonoides]